MFSIFKRRKKEVDFFSLAANSIRSKYSKEEYLKKFHATGNHDWFDFSYNKHDYTEFSRGLFWLCSLEIFDEISAQNNNSKIIDPSKSEMIFFEGIFFSCCAIDKLDNEKCFNDLYGRRGNFYKLDGAELVLDELFDLCCDIHELSIIDPQEIVDMWEDRVQFYNQLNGDNVSDLFKAICHLFSLAVRIHGDFTVNNVLEIDVFDPRKMMNYDPMEAVFFQVPAENALLNFIDIARGTMYGYREEDYK